MIRETGGPHSAVGRSANQCLGWCWCWCTYVVWKLLTSGKAVTELSDLQAGLAVAELWLVANCL